MLQESPKKAWHFSVLETQSFSPVITDHDSRGGRLQTQTVPTYSLDGKRPAALPCHQTISPATRVHPRDQTQERILRKHWDSIQVVVVVVAVVVVVVVVVVGGSRWIATC